MNVANKRKLVSKAAEKIWSDFEWLSAHTNTPFLTSEFPINKNWSIFAFQESDETDENDKWVTITIEKYNDKGRCVDDFVVTTIAFTLSRQAIGTSIGTLLKLFDKKTGNLDVLSSEV